MVKVSLKAVIGTINAFIVLIVAGVTLAITYTVSLNSLRAIGEKHAISLASPVVASAETYFGRAASHAKVIRRMVNDTGYMLPRDEPSDGSWVRKWTVPLRDILLQSDKSYQSVRVVLNDGSAVMAYYEPDYPGFVGLYATDMRTYSSTTSSGATRYKEVYDTNNGAFLRLTDSRLPVVQANNDTGDYRNTVFLQNLLSATQTGSVDASVGKISIFQFNGVGTALFGIQFTIPVHNASGGRALGFADITVTLSSLDSFMASIPATAGTQAYLVDEFGYIIASSNKNASFVFIQTDVDPSSATKDQTGCTSTLQTALRTYPKIAVGCRSKITEFKTFAPLQDLALQDEASGGSVLSATDITVGTLESGGANWYFSSTPITGSLRTAPMRLVLLLPETDVIGDIITGRNIALIVSGCTFVLAVGLAVVLITVLLSPLHIIAYRMRAAAAMEDDLDAGTISRLKEVAEIEASYYEMNEQLNRIRTFVPASVLRTNEPDSEEDDDEESGVKEDTGSARVASENGSEGPQSHRSNNSRGTGTGTGTGTGRNSGRSQGSRVQNSARSNKYLESGPGGKGAVAMSGRSARHVPIKQLNLACSLTSSRCAVLAFDVRGFNEYSKKVSIDALIAHFKTSMDLIISVINDQKGVLDVFSGDHVIASFNAVRPAAAASKRACIAALKISEEMKDKFELQVYSGISSGLALVGNVGCRESMRFNIIGSVMSQACILRRLCRLYHDTDVLMPSVVFNDVSTHIKYQVVDIVHLPGAQKPCAIAKALEEKNQSDNDEWLYVVGEGGDTDLDARNTAMESLSKGELGPAQDCIVKYDQSSGKLDRDPVIDKIRALLKQSQQDKCTDLGLFYSSFVPPKAAGPPALA